MSARKVKAVRAWGLVRNDKLLPFADSRRPIAFQDTIIRVLITPLPAARRRKKGRKK